MRALGTEDLDALCAAIGGPLLLTLAPEETTPEVIARLARAGIVVFGGHSEADHATVIAAAGAGLRGGTHLFNAMSQVAGRAPGRVGALFDDERPFAGIIADDIHVLPANLRPARRVMAGRLFLVTDAIATLDAPEARFVVDGKEIRQMDGRLADAVRDMIRLGGASPAEALRMASGVPARALGLEGELGRIAPGMRASLTLFDADLRAAGVVIDGRPF